MSPQQIAALFVETLRPPTPAEQRWAEYRKLLDQADEIAKQNGFDVSACRAIRP